MFFVDQLKCIAITVWKASGWSAQNGLEALKDKCLVEEIEDHVPVLRMHDHLRDLGREMANELSQPRRLWRPQDLKKLESQGLENIIAQIKGRCFHSFFDKSLNSEVQFFLGESDHSAGMSSCLLWLHLCYPYVRKPQHESLSVQPGIPSWIPLQNMQCLRISNGCFKRLWQDDAEGPSELKKLEIYGTFLEEYPDFLGILTHVEKKVEQEVEKEVVKEVNEGQHISKIKSLIVKTCKRLCRSVRTTSPREFPSFKVPLNDGTESTTVKVPLSMVEDLVIKEQENIRRIVIDGSYCPSLQSLELSSVRNLIEMHFTRVDTLNCLNVNECEHLKILSVTSDDSDLTELKDLSISECPMLEETDLGHLSCLKKIRIENCNLNSVPGIFNYKMLEELNISRCPKLHELRLAHLSCLEKIIVNKCDHLKSVTGLSHLLQLVEVSIFRCGMLQLDLCLEGLNSLKRIKADRSVKVKCFELTGCKNLETVSGVLFEMIPKVKICDCPELKNFPVICGRRCLELIIIDGYANLNNLTLTDCGILNRFSGNFDLNGLSISDCPTLKEVPSFGHLIKLEEIRIFQCGSLQNMTLPTTLKRLEVNSCRELKKMVGISGLTKLVELNIKSCPKLPLELNLSSLKDLKRITIVECWSVFNITLPTTLIEVTLQRCMKLQFKAGISRLTKLRALHVSECPVIEEMPVVCGLSCLERITIDGWGKFSYLHVTDCVILKSIRGNLDMGHLAQLWISDCPELEELPCFARLTCLVEIRIFRCRKLQQVTLPRTLKNLQLVACKELKSVSEISCLKNPVELIISQCGQLELELRLEAIDSLQTIRFDGCGKIKSFQLNKCQNIKRVSSNFDVEWISICGCHELEELSIRDCRGLSCVKEITIESCDKLQNITLPAKLTNLIVQRWRHLQSIAGTDDLSKLTELDITECPEIELPFLAKLSCLERITINSSEKLHKMILPASVKKITVQWCRNLQMVAGIGNLLNLKELYISKCPELEELPSLARLSCLKMIVIGSCEKLHNIILPTTLIKLTVQNLYRGSQMLAAIENLTELEELSICESPEIEELPSLARLSCLKIIVINSCEKLHNIILPTTLIKLRVRRCRGLRMVAGIGNLTKLKDMFIDECPELEELPILAGLSCLEMIAINSCEKLHNIILPNTLIKLTVQKIYRGTQILTAIENCPELEELSICETLELEELPNLVRLSCLKIIVIGSCEKLHNIILPTTLIKLTVQNLYRGSQMLTAIENLTEFEELSICESPELEELPSLARLSCLKIIVIDSCEKLHNIILPTTLIKLTVRRCRGLRMVAGIGNLTKLKDICIDECPELEELPILAGLSCLEMIGINSCEKLHNIIMPNTLIKLTVQKLYRGSQILTAIENLTELEELSICETPELEELPSFAKLNRLKMVAIDSCKKFHNITLLTTLIELRVQECRELPILGGLSCLKSIIVKSCESLESIKGIHGLQALEAIQFLYCSKEAMQDCVRKMKRIPSTSIQVVGRAADGAKSNLNPLLLCEPYLHHPTIWHSQRASIIICGVVEVGVSSSTLHTINESAEDSAWKFKLRQGEWIITTMINHENYGQFYSQYPILSQKGIIKEWCAWEVMKGEDWRIRRALTTIIDTLHQK